MLEEIHTRFGISDKVVCTVTDNGSNFVKAFKEFSETAQADHDSTQTVLQQSINGDILFTNVGDLLNDDSDNRDNQYALPPHHRCGAHTMNLVAVVDSDTACEDLAYKKISRATLAKCTALWNKSSRSPLAAETVFEATSRILIVPNATRWNSFYVAVEKIHSII